MTKKVFLDTNIFIYFLDESQEKKQLSCAKIFELIEDGKLIPYSSNVVFLELTYVLIKNYKLSKKKASQILKTFLNMRNFSLVEKTNSKLAIDYFEKYNIKFGDCHIACQIPTQTTLLSYDEDFEKIKEIECVKPEEFLIL
jgi:predicted nucleic acid-binding protein